MQTATKFSWTNIRNVYDQDLPPTVVERLSWYETHLPWHRVGYYTSEGLTILLAALVPVSVAAKWPASLTALLGALVVAVTGLRQLGRLGETWVRFSAALVAIQGAVVSWSFAREPYNNRDDANAILASNVESIVIAETGEWAIMRRKNNQDNNSGNQ